ncbi:hypothetical protein CH352_18780 [Leptospira hartskeerlii]|uniref:Uncharacterized protein n=1 Tax=Leptospira hartskeerlii TaxID=2023177 RepID=A0A2M9X8A7_9LEPT|nr:hypothetical protein [Leptospira hartskeerlii]PJZ23927.1 hypothetical protein CH357_18690 [Leptospira hartskeerlii]PJZ31935.1 hypothetical protein CH352_18780 [Leptospira hartskeerlii]
MKYIKKVIVHPADNDKYSEVEIIKRDKAKSTLKKLGAVRIKIDINELKNITFELSEEEIEEFKDKLKGSIKDAKYIKY